MKEPLGNYFTLPAALTQTIVIKLPLCKSPWIILICFLGVQRSTPAVHHCLLLVPFEAMYEEYNYEKQARINLPQIIHLTLTTKANQIHWYESMNEQIMQKIPIGSSQGGMMLPLKICNSLYVALGPCNLLSVVVGNSARFGNCPLSAHLHFPFLLFLSRVKTLDAGLKCHWQ